jgi:hypothetical protein
MIYAWLQRMLPGVRRGVYPLSEGLKTGSPGSNVRRNGKTAQEESAAIDPGIETHFIGAPRGTSWIRCALAGTHRADDPHYSHVREGR